MLVEGPTTWRSACVILLKKSENEIRLCIDMRTANSAIIRERYQFEEIIQEMDSAKIFSKIDILKAYFQLIQLNKTSRGSTAFT